MALVQFGTTVTGIRGTVGGLTFSFGTGGAYCRRWSRPGRKTTVMQSERRGVLSLMGGYWNQIDQADRDDWDTFAAAPNELDYDAWSVQRYLSGFQWFSRATLRRISVGAYSVGAVPSGAAATVPANAALSLCVFGTGNSEVTWDSGSFGATDSAVLHLSMGRGVGVREMQRGFLKVLALYNPGDTGEDISDEVLAAFGDIAVGQRGTAYLWKQADEGNRSVVTVLNTIVV